MAFTSLTRELDDKNSPIRQLMQTRYPHLRPVQSSYRGLAGAIRVPGGSAHPGVLGGAFDFVMRFSLEPSYDCDLASMAFRVGSTEHRAVRDVVTEAQQARFGSPERLFRACWALALCTEVYRIGGISSESQLAALYQRRRFHASALMNLAPDDALDQMSQLQRVADVAFYPHVDRTHLALGPVFAGSSYVAADADAIATGELIEIKTRVGGKNSAGKRYDSLSNIDIYQMVGYALFDLDDAYALHSISMYSARYGVFARWSARDLISTLAGRPVDLADERLALLHVLRAY